VRLSKRAYDAHRAMTSPRNYVASGYFLSLWVETKNTLGFELRRVTLANDHSKRVFFPDAWALSWSQSQATERAAEAARFGIPPEDLPNVMAWADRGFNQTFGAWSAFFRLEEARAAAHSMLRRAEGLELWGAGLHRDLVAGYCEASTPPPSAPGFAPTGAGGAHIATCERARPLADGGAVLGHELLIEDIGCAFNSPESRHLNERAVHEAVGVIPNGLGLIDSLDDALACCKYLDAHAAEMSPQITGWLPWLMVRYAL
jgi:hypothetical protein